MPKSTDFLAQKELLNQLRQSTENEVKTYHQLQRRLKRDKQNCKFLAKRIKQSNQVLITAGQEPVSMEYVPSDDDEKVEDAEEVLPVAKTSKLKQAWEKIPNLAE